MLQEILLRAAGGRVELTWSSGARTSIDSASLRSACPCAECRSLCGAAPLPLSPGVAVASVEPYGPNAVVIGFSDGHRRGIFPFAYLRELGTIVE